MHHAVNAAHLFLDRYQDGSEPDERGFCLAGRFRIIRRQKRGDPNAEARESDNSVVC